ncbi:unnamed protein product [Nezara viridula]|uniref:Uncharacterized protein n=1 Tax=Nezara viridula TaxID=85310 RepID=A0A9P0MMN7_NEZVI|nr:unnamed protein product [Nezara viridula]
MTKHRKGKRKKQPGARKPSKKMRPVSEIIAEVQRSVKHISQAEINDWDLEVERKEEAKELPPAEVHQDFVKHFGDLFQDDDID